MPLAAVEWHTLSPLKAPEGYTSNWEENDTNNVSVITSVLLYGAVEKER